jgi:hypothetical protein
MVSRVQKKSIMTIVYICDNNVLRLCEAEKASLENIIFLNIESRA